MQATNYGGFNGGRSRLDVLSNFFKLGNYIFAVDA
jgi:hypothetical protein